MSVELIVVDTCPFCYVAVEPISIWDVFAFGDGFEPNLQGGQCTMVWFKFPAYTYFLDVEAAIGVVSLDLFDHFDHRLDGLVLFHKSRYELDVMIDFDE